MGDHGTKCIGSSGRLRASWSCLSRHGPSWHLCICADGAAPDAGGIKAGEIMAPHELAICIRVPYDLSQLDWFQILVASLPRLASASLSCFSRHAPSWHLCSCADGAAPDAGGIKAGAIVAPCALAMCIRLPDGLSQLFQIVVASLQWLMYIG